ncbi:MAG: M15 family metallopeptidase [Clostridia bacterium]|nr:M15 family metallopeptidase [Clostridia bacterium]
MKKKSDSLAAVLLVIVLVAAAIAGCFVIKNKTEKDNSGTTQSESNIYTVENTTEKMPITKIIETTASTVSETQTTEEETASVTEETSSEKSKTEESTDETTAKKITSSSTTKKTTTTTTKSTTKKTTTQKVKNATYIKGILVVNKTYALPEDYAPGVNPEAKGAFDKMAADAAKEGLDLHIRSGYRSYSYQKNLYNNYVAQDGKAAADRYSARPGHSEHQTGLAFDVNSLSQSFENTAEGKWMAKNCWKYGFIIRYPKGKESITGYMYEPWHIRYLGKENAKAVHDSGLTLEEYLGIDSKYKN